MDFLDKHVISAPCDALLERFRTGLLPVLLDPTLPAEGPLRTIAQLLAAEERLDELEGQGATAAHPEYFALRQRVLAFVATHPELLEAPWLRCAGAVSDMLQELRAPPARD